MASPNQLRMIEAMWRDVCYFDNDKFDIMERGLRAKFAQNRDAAELLHGTGDAILIKSCPVCYKCGFGIGSGTNRIGKIMMDIRENLQK